MPRRSSEDDLTLLEVQAMLDAGEEGKRALIGEILPTIHYRIARILLRLGAKRRVRENVEDLTQEVLLALFAHDARALRAWEPSRGSSFLGFVSLVAERNVYTVLRSGTRRPWGKEEPEDQDSSSDVADDKTDLEDNISSRQFAKRVLNRVQSRSTDLGRDMFRWLIMEQRDVAEICVLAQMEPGAVHIWRNRIMNLIRKTAEELASEA